MKENFDRFHLWPHTQLYDSLSLSHIFSKTNVNKHRNIALMWVPFDKKNWIKRKNNNIKLTLQLILIYIFSLYTAGLTI